MNYGYVRVSTRGQHVDRQIDGLERAGILPPHMYIDYISGKDFKRSAYQRLLKKLRPGDVIYIKSIDRLGRNCEEVIRQWRNLIERDVDIVVLDLPLLNTVSDDQSLTHRFLADMVLQILSYVAQTEREHIKSRQMEGIRLAKKEDNDSGDHRNIVLSSINPYTDGGN